MSAKEIHYFSDLFDKLLYMFQTGPLSIIRTCLKHVEYFIKYIWEIVHLVGFHYKNSKLTLSVKLTSFH